MYVVDEAHLADLVTTFVAFPRVQLSSERYGITDCREFNNCRGIFLNRDCEIPKKVRNSHNTELKKCGGMERNGTERNTARPSRVEVARTIIKHGASIAILLTVANSIGAGSTGCGWRGAQCEQFDGDDSSPPCCPQLMRVDGADACEEWRKS